MEMAKEDLKSIYLLSDTKLYSDAEQFVQKFLSECRPMTANQLNGLENIIISTTDISDILTYVRHQKEKATKNADPRRRNRDYCVAQFYQQFEHTCHTLKTYIKTHPGTFPRIGSSQNARPDAVAMYQYYMIQEFAK